MHLNLNLQDGIQLIEAAYEVFIQGTTDNKELRSYIFELQTKAMLNLEMSRIKDYLKIIAEKDGIPVCQDVAEYVQSCKMSRIWWIYPSFFPLRSGVIF